MSRLATRFTKLNGDHRKALVAYIVAGDPMPGTTVDLMHGIVEAGVDVIELGVPFTDPEAEGPVIQAAHERALRHSISLGDTLEMVREFRERDSTTPVVLMGYLNPVERMGYQSFAEAAGNVGVDGLITVNLPPEEAGALTVTLDDHGVDPIYLLAPTTTELRAAKICAASRGFVYYVSLKGTTGAGGLDVDEVRSRVELLKAHTELPLMVGFGIKDGATAAPIAAVADGVVVGSAIVELMRIHEQDPVALKSAVMDCLAEIRLALNASVA